MRIGNVRGRAVLVDGDAAVDIATASGGRFGPDPMSPYQDWPTFEAWARSADLPAGESFDSPRIGWMVATIVIGRLRGVYYGIVERGVHDGFLWRCGARESRRQAPVVPFERRGMRRVARERRAA